MPVLGFLSFTPFTIITIMSVTVEFLSLRSEVSFAHTQYIVPASKSHVSAWKECAPPPHPIHQHRSLFAGSSLHGQSDSWRLNTSQSQTPTRSVALICNYVHNEMRPWLLSYWWIHYRLFLLFHLNILEIFPPFHSFCNHSKLRLDSYLNVHSQLSLQMPADHRAVI